MSAAQWRIVFTGLLFFFIFLLGFWLSRIGKPYPMLGVTIHKLISLGAVAFLATSAYKANQVAPLSPTLIILLVITALFFVATIVTGGLVSIEKPMPVWIAWVHKVFPYLTVLSTAGSLYLLMGISRAITKAY